MNTVSDKAKLIVYELHIEDMLHMLKDRLAELNGNPSLDEFQQGRQLVYMEMLDVIKTKHQMIWGMFEDDDSG